MIKENLVGTIEKSIVKNWNSPCFSDYGGETYSYADVAANISRLHVLFKSLEEKSLKDYLEYKAEYHLIVVEI